MTVRVLHVLDHSIPLHSGYTFRTLAILREQRRLGWETFHLTSPKHTAPGDAEETVDGWHFYRTAAPSGPKLPGLTEVAMMRATQARLLALARDLKPQILHAHSPVLNAIPALRVGRALGIPVVYEVRAFWEDAAVDHGTTSEGSLRYQATRRLETYALQRAAHVFTICEGLRRDIVERGIPAAKVTVIPNAVDIDNFEPGGTPDEALKSQLGLAGCTVLGFIGSFYAYEGLDLLLEALPALLRERPDVRVLLVGGGPQEAALKAQAQHLGVADKVVFTGRVPHAEVKRFYDLVDVLTYPRHSMRLTELVTPLKPLEAMAQGRLLVASNVGGHRELIRHGETGLLFEAGSKQALIATVLDLLTQRDRWPQLRAAGRRFVETERNWSLSASRYQAVFERVALLADMNRERPPMNADYSFRADAGRIVRAVATNQLARLAPELYVRLTGQTGRGVPAEESPADVATYFRDCADAYFEHLGVPRDKVSAYLKDKVLMEYGPGDLPGVAALMVAKGARKVYCVDRFPLVNLSPKNTRVIAELISGCLGDERDRLRACLVNPDDPTAGFMPDRIEYLVRPSGLSGLDSAVDLVFSRAVLEHVDTLEATFDDMVRAMRPGATAIHQVDLRSHGLHKTNRLDFLAWSPTLWQQMYSQKGMPNRWRADVYRRNTERLPVDVLEFTPTEQATADEISAIRPTLASPFRNTSDQDLSWLGLWMVLRKRAEIDS